MGAALVPSAVIKEVDRSAKKVFEIASLYREDEESSTSDEKKKLPENK